MKAAQERLAAACDTVILTEVDAGAHQPGVIERALSALSPTRDRGRFDLLTVPDFAELTDVENPDYMGLVAGDVRTALSLHQPERLVIMTFGSPRELVGAFRARPEFRGTDLKVLGVNLTQFASPTPMTRLLVTCMDYRMQGAQGGLIARITHAAGAGSYGVLATVGGGKELSEQCLRRSMAVAGIRKLRRHGTGPRELYVATHMDCGKYGGHKAFKNRLEEVARLSQDASEAAASLSRELDMPATALVAMIEGERLARFRAPAPIKTV